MSDHDGEIDDLSASFRQGYIADGRFQIRNSEDVHRVALAAAQAEHARVRDIALKAFAMNELRESQHRLHQVVQQEEERVRLETARATEEIRMRELENAARRIPKPPPRLPTPPPPPPPSPPQVQQPPSPVLPVPQTVPTALLKPPATTPFTNTQPPPPPNPSITAPIPSVTAPSPSVSTSTPAPAPIPPPANPVPRPNQLKNGHILPGADRYAEIFQDLKALRAQVSTWRKSDPALDAKASRLRSVLRMSTGQLTQDPKINVGIRQKVINSLRDAMTDQKPNHQLSPVSLVVSPRQPIEGESAMDTMPGLFLYCLNIFAKSIVEQLMSEGSARPEACEPIGVLTVAIFGRHEFSWRGKSLIDILIAKVRVMCPVLFGFRGDDKKEGGRAAVGWRKEGGRWIGEQDHNARMMGLGAGYAAICLRDFGVSANSTHPWPPTHYWQTMSVIVNTPPEQCSATQLTVLRAMIDNFEAAFFKFYGDAAKAALKIALVDFPAKQKNQKDVAVQSLAVLASRLEKDAGLRLRT